MEGDSFPFEGGQYTSALEVIQSFENVLGRLTNGPHLGDGLSMVGDDHSLSFPDQSQQFGEPRFGVIG